MISKFFIILLSWLVYGFTLTLYPIYLQLKCIWYNITRPRYIGCYRYYNFIGGFTILKVESKKQIDTLFAIYQIPDKNIFVTYWRLWHKLNLFTIGLNFEEYCDCNKYELLKFTATIDDYKNGKINNLIYKTNYDKGNKTDH